MGEGRVSSAVPRRAVRLSAAAGGCVLAALAAAYYLTYEPAPRIGILWRPGISDGRRAELERRFMLVNRAPEDDRFAYDLLDTTRTNIEAMVHEPDVADTDRVSRERFEVPLDVPYGSSWMWAAHRTPILRLPGAVPAIVAVCLALCGAGALIERRGRRADRRASPPATPEARSHFP